MTTRTLALVAAALTTAAFSAPGTAQGSEGSHLAYDLIEVTDAPNPLHPGIDFERHPISIAETEMGGTAVVDFDDDGLLDIFFTNTEGHPNQLYRNLGDGTFADEAGLRGVDEPSKRRGAVAFFDMENDGDLDLLTCGYPGLNVLNLDLFSLFRSNGAPDFDFTEVTQSAGGFVLAPTMQPTIQGSPSGCTVADCDGDGYLDFLTAYFRRSPDYSFAQPRLFLNRPNSVPIAPEQEDYSERAFLDKTIESGLNFTIQGWVHTPTLIDLDRDGFPDLHFCVDFGKDVLLLNNGDSTFGPVDIASSVGMNGNPVENRNEMGFAAADIDFDLDLDIFLTNAHQNDRTYRNDSALGVGGGGLAFVDVATQTTTFDCDFGWGAVWADMDNDKDLDLLAVCGMDQPYPNKVWENLWPQKAPGGGKVPLFADRSDFFPDFQKDAAKGPEADISRSLILFDYDSDGDLDALVGRPGDNGIATTGSHVKAGLFVNTLQNNKRWIEVDLRDAGGSRNTVGARVYLQTAKSIQMREIVVGTSYVAQEPYRLHFGLGNEDVKWVAVRWHDGAHSVWGVLSDGGAVTLDRQAVDHSGDLNGDGVVNGTDVYLFGQSIIRPRKMDDAFNHWPWEILADMNGDGAQDDLDRAMIEQKAGL